MRRPYASAWLARPVQVPGRQRWRGVSWDHESELLPIFAGGQTEGRKAYIVIEDDVAIGRSVTLETVQFSSRCITVGPIHIEKGSSLGIESYVGPYSHIAPHVRLEAVSALQFDHATGKGSVWAGSPAIRIPGKTNGRSKIVSSRERASVESMRWGKFRFTVTKISLLP